MDALYTIFNIPSESVISIAEFKEMCPALVQQIDGDACIDMETHLPLRTAHKHNHDDHAVEKLADDGDWKRKIYLLYVKRNYLICYLS